MWIKFNPTTNGLGKTANSYTFDKLIMFMYGRIIIFLEMV